MADALRWEMDHGGLRLRYDHGRFVVGIAAVDEIAHDVAWANCFTADDMRALSEFALAVARRLDGTDHG